MVDDVPEPEKTRRIVALQQTQREIQLGLYEAAIGRTEDVLVDGLSARREWELAGRTSGNTIVNFAGEPSLVGQLVTVRITEATPNALRGVRV
jgi:tRNA-2-methylthio-N6-dimethylallyladenosine synthase